MECLKMTKRSRFRSSNKNFNPRASLMTWFPIQPSLHIIYGVNNPRRYGGQGEHKAHRDAMDDVERLPRTYLLGSRERPKDRNTSIIVPCR